jgi:predicted Rossmann fold nucleotide-binding protein DprA/Smf involved in DNA uptake
MVYPDEMERLTEKQEAPLPKVAQKASIFGHGKEKKKKEIDTTQSSHYIDAEVKRPPMTAQEETILSLVQQGRTLVDDIIAESNMPAGAVLAVLTMLEVKGVLKRLPGKRVELK